MSAALQRFTTEFLPEEDRLRLSGELEDGQQVVLWLTQRLLRRVVPHLCSWLEKQPVPGASAARAQTMALQREQIHQMAQQAAQGALDAQKSEPVLAPSSAFSGLVQIVRLEAHAGQLQLTLRVEQAAPVEFHVAFGAVALRQWLGIVHRHYESAQWPLAIWPQWMAPGGAAHGEPSAAAVLH